MNTSRIVLFIAAALFFNPTSLYANSGPCSAFLGEPSHAKIFWTELTLDEKAETLEFDSHIDIPGIRAITLVEGLPSTPFHPTQVHHKSYRVFIEKMFETFEGEVSTEAIEQSEYLPIGPPQVRRLSLLVTGRNEILGGRVTYFQDGRLQDGTGYDINWDATLRVDANAEVLRNSRGIAYDDLYFEWAGL